MSRIAVALALGLIPLTISAVAAPCPDVDGDDYADCTVPACDPAGLSCGDCDDGDDAVHPGAAEVCNHRDDDCDRRVDEDAPPLASFQGLRDRHPAASDRFAASVAGIGDVTGDGVPDLVVANPYDDPGTSQGGSVAVFSGSDRSLVWQVSGVASDELGTTVACLGDVNGDGFADVAASSPNHDFVQLLSGADGAAIARCSDPGVDVAGLGSNHGLARWTDVTGDGVPEFLAGACTSNTTLHHAGRAVVFSPTASGGCSVLRVLADPEAEIYDNLGFAVEGLGDVNGDAIPDLAVGEPGDHDNFGAVLLFSGADGSVLRRLLDPGGALSDRLGEGLAALDDLDGDGIGELAVGSPRKTTAGGAAGGHVLVFSPEEGVILRDLIDADGGDNDWLGWSLAAVADLDGDGRKDLVAGASRADLGGRVDAGKAVVFSTATWAELFEVIDPDGLGGDQLGYAVADGGDLSGDGVSEILAGAPYDDGAVGVDEGSLLLFSRETDCDGDGLGPFGGDCDDTAGEVWRVPGPVAALTFAADRQTLGWDPPADTGNATGEVLYDTLRAGSPAGFGAAACLDSGGSDLATSDPTVPAAGTGLYYLARAENACGEGSLGESSSRDARDGCACP